MLDSATLTSLASIVVVPLLLRSAFSFLRGTGASRAAPSARLRSPWRPTLCAPSSFSDVLLLLLLLGVLLHAARSLLALPTDLFWASHTPINASTATLRANIAVHWSAVARRWSGSEEQLERILKRCASYEGRKLYLLLSHAPLLDCTYCLSSSDFKSWAFLLTLPLYALHLLAFGLLTASASALGALDALAARLAALLRRREAGAVPPHREQTYALDRSAWRKSGAWIIAGIAGAEYCLLFGAADSLEQSVPKWALHWSRTLPLLRSCLLATLFVVVYIYPTHLPLTPISRISTSLRATLSHVESTLSAVQAAHVAHVALLRDEGMRGRAEEYWQAMPRTQQSEGEREYRTQAAEAARAAWREVELLRMGEEQ